MKCLYTPWRYDYIVSAKEEGCIFCAASENGEDERHLVLYRGAACFVLLNRFPYNNGHLMIAPYAHAASLAEAAPAALEEMMRVLKETHGVLRDEYRPAGFNVGMNLGRTSGAGIPDHLHLHIVPRWDGDTSFMTVLADTRIIPEIPEDAFKRLRPLFDKIAKI